MIDSTPNKGRLGAGRAFVALAAVFVALFGVVVLLIWLDQQKVLDATNRLQDDTVPEIIRYQRLSRNLEQLRQEGERVFAVSSPQARQQALFVATLVASHPSVLDHRPAADLARQVERFLAEVLRQSASDERAIARNYEVWQQLSAQVSLLVDDVSVQGVNLASRDLREVSAAMQVARYKLIAVVFLAALFLGVFLFFVRQTLIHPLQNIYRKLSQLSVDQPPPTFPPAHMLEIQAVEESIVELHASLVANEAARQQLELLANRDGLTGLTNRRHFMLLAEQELARAQRYRRSLTVGMADLDHFKRLNDTYGHAAGDAVLKAFAALVGDTLRQSDLSCRYGGEEFAFLFPEVGIDEARRLAERLRERFSELEIRLPDGRLVRVTFSMGLADATVLPLEGALKLADEALYEAKRSGRNRIAVAGTLSEA